MSRRGWWSALTPRRLRTQVAGSAAATVMVMFALAGVAIVLRTHDQDIAQIDRQLVTRGQRVGGIAAQLLNPASSRKVRLGGHEADLLSGSQSVIRLLARDRVVTQMGDLPRADIPIPERVGLSTIVVGSQKWRSLVWTVGGGGRIQILASLAPAEQRLHYSAELIALVALIAAVIAAAAVWMLTGMIVAPLQRLSAGALAIRPGRNAGARLPEVRGPQEVCELSTALAGMLQRLETSMLATQRFTADAGHELRTPLTSLGANLETLRHNSTLPADQQQEVLRAMCEEHARIVDLLTGLQTLARGDSGALPVHDEVDVSELVVEAVDRAQSRHPEVTFVLHDDLAGTAVVCGWRDGLRIALDNLVDNAARHGRDPGTAEVGVHAARGGRVLIVVSDDGPGIPPPQRQAMRQRFTRGPSPRGEGSGLGLALVDQQAELHGGSLTLGDSRGGGLAAALDLPARFTAGTSLEPSQEGH